MSKRALNFPMEPRELYEVIPRQEGGWVITRSLAWRMREFRAKRTDVIAEGNAMISLEDGPKAILHLIPHVAVMSEAEIDIKQFVNRTAELEPLAAGGWNHRFNADGFLTFTSLHDGRCSGYVQLFRNGIVEAVSSGLFTVNAEKTIIASHYFEQQLLNAVARFTKLLLSLGIPEPYSTAITLVGVKGAEMGVDPGRHLRFERSPIDVAVLHAPFVELGPQSEEVVLRPIFDYFWQAAGWSGSIYYDENGSRKK